MEYDSKPLFLPVLLSAALIGLIGCERQSVSKGPLPTPAVVVPSNGTMRTTSIELPPANPAPAAPLVQLPVLSGPVAPATLVPAPTLAPMPVATLIPTLVPVQRLPILTPLPPAQIVPTLAPLPVIPAPNAANVNCGQNINHVVASNDNLFRIALKYNTTIEALAAANGVTDVRQLRVGQNIKVTGCRKDTTPSTPGTQPTAGGYYIVQKNDNLYRIALKHNTTVEELTAANGIPNTLVYPGQKIYVP